MGSDCRSTGSVGTLGRTRIPIQNNHYTLMILLISELLILAVSGSHNHRKVVARALEIPFYRTRRLSRYQLVDVRMVYHRRFDCGNRREGTGQQG
jgi:hypothetical protein